MRRGRVSFYRLDLLKAVALVNKKAESATITPEFYLKKSSYYDEPFSYNMSGIELQNEGMQWVQETVNLQTVNLDNSYDGNGNKTQNDFKLKFTLKPIFSIASVRKNSPAAASGIQVGDLIISIN